MSVPRCAMHTISAYHVTSRHAARAGIKVLAKPEIETAGKTAAGFGRSYGCDYSVHAPVFPTTDSDGLICC